MTVARVTLALSLCVASLAPRVADAQAGVHAPPPSAPALPPAEALRPAPPATVVKRVRVIDLGGDVAYLDLGARDGLRLSQAVAVGERRFFVAALNERHAAIALEGQLLALGSEGTVIVLRDPAPLESQLRAERTLAAYRGQWPKPVLPSDKKPATPVPLGPFASIAPGPSRADVDLSARTTSVVPLSRNDDVVGMSELRARLRAEPFEAVPLAVLADASWLGAWARSSATAQRPSARVRELELRYGAERGVLLRAGRMLSPAPMLGELDGARARTAYFGPLAAGAFGGLVPDPIDGRLDDSSKRFGVDLALDAPEASTRPYASLVAHGTTFEDQIDERKLDLLLGLRPGDVQIHAGGELSLYDEDSELADDTVELTLAHLDTVYQGDRIVFGVRGSTYVPERSERLRALLDISRSCTTVAGSFGCADFLPRRYAAGGDFSIALGSALWLDTDATFATESSEALEHVSGRVGVRWLDPMRPGGALLASSVSLTGSGTHDIYYEHVAMRLTLDARFAPAFDLTLAYEPGLASYASERRTLFLHDTQLDFAWAITRALQWVWSSQAELGDEVNALYLGTLFRVRP
jgi:hypothetical protein